MFAFLTNLNEGKIQGVQNFEKPWKEKFSDSAGKLYACAGLVGVRSDSNRFPSDFKSWFDFRKGKAVNCYCIIFIYFKMYKNTKTVIYVWNGSETQAFQKDFALPYTQFKLNQNSTKSKIFSLHLCLKNVKGLGFAFQPFFATFSVFSGQNCAKSKS